MKREAENTKCLVFNETTLILGKSVEFPCRVSCYRIYTESIQNLYRTLNNLKIPLVL